MPDQAPDLLPANESAIESAIEPPMWISPAGGRRAPPPPRRISNSRCCCRRCRSRSAPRSTRPCRRKSPRCAASSAPRSTRIPSACRATSRHCCRRRARRELDLPTVMPERRAWGAIFGWSLALIAIGGAAFMTWLWWNQGGEIAALRTDLTAAYAELETLRARPEVVSPPPPATAPAALDPNAVLPGCRRAGCRCRPRPAVVELVPIARGQSRRLLAPATVPRRPRAAPAPARSRGARIAATATQAQ